MRSTILRPTLYFLLAAVLSFPSPCHGQQKSKDAAAQKHKAAAIAAVERYCAAMKEGKVADGMRQCWDMKAVVEEVFGADASKLGGRETDEVEKSIVDCVAVAFTNPMLARAFAEARFEKFEAAEERDGTVSVRCTVVIESHQFRNTTTYYLHQKGEAWRITAQFTNGRSVIGALRDAYRRVRGKISPTEFARMMVEEAREIANREPAPPSDPAAKP